MGDKDKIKLQYISVLRYLNELGISLDNPDTNIYLIMIWKLITEINNVENEDYHQLLPLVYEVKNPQSSFYKDLAAYIGFPANDIHKKLNNLINSIDYEKANQELYKELFCRVYENVDYGEFAFLIASYATGKMKKDTYINEEMPKVRQLSKPNK